MLTGILVDLVPLGPDFMEKNFEWFNGPAEFWADMGQRRVVSRATIERWHEEWQNEEPEKHTGVNFGIRTKDGKPIGFMEMHFVSAHNRVSDLGASIGDTAYWGGGFGSDALCLIVEYAFRWLDLRRLGLTTMSLNERAMRNVEKCGFRLEVRGRNGVFADGKYYDEMHYGLLRAEWPGYDVLAERLKFREKAAQFYGKAEEAMSVVSPDGAE